MRRAVLTALLLTLLAAVPAQAAFPGQNGKLVFSSERDEPGNRDLYTVNPDGTSVSRLTTDPAIDRSPRWSPDGKRIIFQRTFSPGVHTWYLINADGSGENAISLPINTIHAAWSPDATKIVYARVGTGSGMWISNPDGSSPTFVGNYTQHCVDPRSVYSHQSWSPDGGKIAFQICGLDGGEIATVDSDGSNFQKVATIGGPVITNSRPDWSPDAAHITWEADNRVMAMNRDGTGKTPLGAGQNPVWSPDNGRIAFQTGAGIAVMNSNGTGPAPVIADSTLLTNIDWQPIPVNGYPRPKGASPLRVSLVTAYEQCTAGNRTHGPPLDSASCNPPSQSSAYLTVGTGDSNGKPARSEGHLRLRTLVGAPDPPDDTDVLIDVSIDDVFTNALADYTGQLLVEASLRITDKDNAGGPGGPNGAATVVDIPLVVEVGCSAVADPQEGSVCATTTSADAIVPGSAKEGKRTIWEVGQVIVYDGGPDGIADTENNTVFAREGIFIP